MSVYKPGLSADYVCCSYTAQGCNHKPR